MAAEYRVESMPVLVSQDDGSGKLKRVTVAMLAVALVCGIAMMATDVRFGLLAAALILGWTQLVGL